MCYSSMLNSRELFLAISMNLFQPKFNVPANMGYSATERLKQLYERQKEKEEREKTFGLENLKIEVQK